MIIEEFIEGELYITENNNEDWPEKIVRFISKEFGFETLNGEPFLYEGTTFRKYTHIA